MQQKMHIYTNSNGSLARHLASSKGNRYIDSDDEFMEHPEEEDTAADMILTLTLTLTLTLIGTRGRRTYCGNCLRKTAGNPFAP